MKLQDQDRCRQSKVLYLIFASLKHCNSGIFLCMVFYSAQDRHFTLRGIGCADVEGKSYLRQEKLPVVTMI